MEGGTSKQRSMEGACERFRNAETKDGISGKTAGERIHRLHVCTVKDINRDKYKPTTQKGDKLWLL